jgi:hypothetical protein
MVFKPTIFNRLTVVALFCSITCIASAQGERAITLCRTTSSSAPDLPLRRLLLVDLKGRPRSPSSGVRDGSQFYVRITNVNTLNYIVKVKANKETYNTDVPKAFKPAADPKGTEGFRASELSPANLQAAASVIEALNALEAEVSIRARAAQSSADLEEVKAFTNAAVVRFYSRIDSALGADTPKQPERHIANVIAELVGAYPDLLKNALKQRSLSENDPEQRQGDLASYKVAIQNRERIDAEIRGIKDLQASSNALLAKAGRVQALVLSAISKDYMEATVDESITAEGDDILLTVSFEKRAQASADVPALSDMSATVPVRGGFKIDFSAGPMVTSLADFEYTTRQTPGTGTDDIPATYTVSGASSPQHSVRPVALAHFYFTKIDRVNAGFTFGIVAQDNPIYTVGASFMVGRKQRLVVSTGIAFGQVTRLVPGTPSVISDTTPPTHKVYMSRPFLAISYNF